MQSVDLQSSDFPHTAKAMLPVVQMGKDDEKPVREKGFLNYLLPLNQIIHLSLPYT